jgi:hypothetical protein
MDSRVVLSFPATLVYTLCEPVSAPPCALVDFLAIKGLVVLGEAKDGEGNVARSRSASRAPVWPGDMLLNVPAEELERLLNVLIAIWHTGNVEDFHHFSGIHETGLGSLV